MRPEKSEVADPRFSKSTALALEKQARERERRSRAAGDHAVRVAAWPSPWRHLCLWSSPPSQARQGSQGQVTAWGGRVQVGMWAGPDRLRLQGRSVDGGWPGWLRPLSTARVAFSFSDGCGSLTQAPALFNRATAGAAGVQFRAQKTCLMRREKPRLAELGCGSRFSTRAASVYERLWRTQSRVVKTMHLGRCRFRAFSFATSPWNCCAGACNGSGCSRIGGCTV